MVEKIEDYFKELIFSLQMAKLYGLEHPKFEASIDKVHSGLQDILRSREELVIGIVGDELAFEKEIFFDLSSTIKPIIESLKGRGIEKITFSSNAQKEELRRFIIFLVSYKETEGQSPQEYLSAIGVRNISVGKIGVPSGAEAGKEDKPSPTALDTLALYNDSLASYNSALDTVIEGNPVDNLKLRLTLESVMEKIINNYQEFLNLCTVKRYDSGTFVHILNVSILSMYFSFKLGFSKDEVLEIGTAALFHDIGKLYISRKILSKPARLTDEEFAKIKSHVTFGAQIMLKYAGALGILPVVVAFEHHLKYDLNGYPKLFIRCKPHKVSLIVSICDVYDALSQRRSYKNDYPPNLIHEIMVKDKNTAFDPQLLDSFFKIMGVWPIGSIVVLTDQRVAVVRDQNEEDIFSPKVEILSSGEKTIVDLKESKERVKIERYLNPYTEGKPYLELVTK